MAINNSYLMGLFGGSYDPASSAALTKLVYLFSRGLSPDEVKSQMQLDLRGELTR